LIALPQKNANSSAATDKAEDKDTAEDKDGIEEATPATPQALGKIAYRVRCHFGLPRDSAQQERQFNVSVQGDPAVEQVSLGGQYPSSATCTFERVMLGESIEISFQSLSGRPVLCGLEIVRIDE
jgi:hypothetical protein